MAGKIEAKLAALGIVLPIPAAPIANYIPFNISGKLVVVSGQVPVRDGKIAYTGKLGAGVSIEVGREAARLCFINLLAQLKAAAGDLDNVTRVVRLGGFIAAPADFTQSQTSLPLPPPHRRARMVRQWWSAHGDQHHQILPPQGRKRHSSPRRAA